MRGPKSSRWVRNGSFRRRSDGRRIARFLCARCGRSFSRATLAAERGQRKRQINERLRLLLVSGVSQRRAAELLHVTRRTVARKLVFLSARAERHQARRLIRIRSERGSHFRHLQFDEMESSVHSKCLPVSIPLVVERKTRLILGLDVCEMPSKGPLARISLRKYGPRRDDRARAASALLSSLRPHLSPHLSILSDQNPKYPLWIRTCLPHAEHTCVKGRRGCVVGQGELKRGGFDPLFSLNHTAAMIRANVNRMFRRTWCTSKRIDRLRAHLLLYADAHNERIEKRLREGH